MEETNNGESHVPAVSILPISHNETNLCSPSKLRSFIPAISADLARKVVAETVATYLLVFVSCGAATISKADERRVSHLAASVAGGLIATVMIYAVGHISGAHMNPAITLSFATLRHFPWQQVPLYFVAQLSGAISASFTLRILLEPINQLGTTSPSGTDLQALVMEIVVTFTLMFIIAAVSMDTNAIGELAGLAVGSAVCIGSILAGPVSGGSMNPARTLGPAIASGYYKGLWVYFVGPVLGTLLGAWCYHLIRVSDKPVHAISPHQSLSHGVRRRKSIANDPDMNWATNNEDHLDSF